MTETEGERERPAAKRRQRPALANQWLSSNHGVWGVASHEITKVHIRYILEETHLLQTHFGLLAAFCWFWTTLLSTWPL